MTRYAHESTMTFNPGIDNKPETLLKAEADNNSVTHSEANTSSQLLTVKDHKRSITIALIVGSLLAAINYGDKIIGNTMVNTDWIKLGMTYVVPYCVSIYSVWSAKKKH